MNPLTDDSLRDMRERLLARGAELRERAERAALDLGRAREPLPRDSADAAIVVENDEVLNAIQESALGELRCIERALRRIEKGTFALCETCGGQIDEERLHAIPYATHCRTCAPQA
jgi:DnaK suppressor protein